jgi:hypothetical protein
MLILDTTKLLPNIIMNGRCTLPAQGAARVRVQARGWHSMHYIERLRRIGTHIIVIFGPVVEWV